MVSEEVKKANISLARSKILKAGDWILYYGDLVKVSDVTGNFILIESNKGRRRESATLFRKYTFT